jgi:hypothetical protein
VAIEITQILPGNRFGHKQETIRGGNAPTVLVNVRTQDSPEQILSQSLT